MLVFPLTCAVAEVPDEDDIPHAQKVLFLPPHDTAIPDDPPPARRQRAVAHVLPMSLSQWETLTFTSQEGTMLLRCPLLQLAAYLLRRMIEATVHDDGVPLCIIAIIAVIARIAIIEIIKDYSNYCIHPKFQIE